MSAERSTSAPRAWAVPGVLFASAVLVFLAERASDRAWLALGVVPVVLGGLHCSPRFRGAARTALLAFLVIATLFACHGLTIEILDNLREPPEWDFLGFWLYARTAAAGDEFYAAQFSRVVASGLTVSREFQQEIVATGFWYPPPSMFLFLPLGWFPVRTALALWSSLHAGVLVLNVLLMWRIFFPRGGAVELLAVAALATTMHGTFLTFLFAQTNFVALLGLLMLWYLRDGRLAGFWVAVAFLVKPFLAALGLPLLAARRSRALLGLALSMAVFVLAAAIAFGPGSFLEYFAGNAAQVKPDWIYREWTNQSLLGLVLRARGTRCAGSGCLLDPVYLAAVSSFLAITLPVAFALSRKHERWAGSLTVLVALLVYPVSQSYYSVLLLPMLLLAWVHRDRVRGGAWTLTVLSTAVLALAALDGGRVTVAAYGLLWSFFALVGLRLVQGRGWPLVPGKGTKPTADEAPF